MGPIFSEYLYIQFFSHDKDKLKNADVYWPNSKFNELLMQLRFYVTPDMTLVKPGRQNNEVKLRLIVDYKKLIVRYITRRIICLTAQNTKTGGSQKMMRLFCLHQ